MKDKSLALDFVNHVSGSWAILKKRVSELFHVVLEHWRVRGKVRFLSD